MGVPMRILHVIDALNFGGAQKLVLLIARHWPVQNAQHRVVVLQDQSAMVSMFRESGVPVDVLGRQRPGIAQLNRFLAYGLGSLRDLLSLCRRHRVNVLVLHLSDAEFIGTLAGLLTKVPRIFVVAHVREILPERPSWDVRNFLRRFVLRHLYRKVTGLIAVSREIAQRLTFFMGGDASKIVTILNAVDTASFSKDWDQKREKETLGVDPEIPIILCVGRLAPEKGHIYAIRALARLQEEEIQANLLIAGDGPLRKVLEKEAQRLSVRKRIFFLGNRTDIPRLLGTADIFLLPSLYEGTSLALLEAMAAGKPIVTTDIPPHRQILQAGTNAFLVPPGNPDAISAALRELLADPHKATSMGMEAAATALRDYDIRKLIATLERVWMGEDLSACGEKGA